MWLIYKIALLVAIAFAKLLSPTSTINRPQKKLKAIMFSA
jgi:hypothetical protein